MSNEIINMDKLFAQGDVIISRVDALPEGLTQATKGEAVVAHSETGHNHVVRPHRKDVTVDFFPQDLLTSYVRVRRNVDAKIAEADATLADIDAVLAENTVAARVDHDRSFDTHQTVGLTLREGENEAIFRFRRQQEMGLEGWRIAAD